VCVNNRYKHTITPLIQQEKIPSIFA
jgi:hypothetical protein